MNKLSVHIGLISRFILVGILATGLHYAIYWVFGIALWKVQPPLWIPYVTYSLGYVLSFVFNFYATCYFTFHTHPSWMRLIGMTGAHVVNYLLHIVLLSLWLYVGISRQWAPVPVYAIAVPVNFLLVKYVFRKR